ncbi:MAG: putative acyl-CoA dehydrogenase [Paraglaciecola sp.]|jgi:putative acyl-CoA dehydrogenase
MNFSAHPPISQPDPQTLSQPLGETHKVFNQPTALEQYNAFDTDRVLKYWLQQFNLDWADDLLHAYGNKVGHELLTAGFLANKHKPEFNSHDRFGNRIDQVDFHPAYHQLMQAAIEAGHHCSPWVNPRPGAHVARAAMEYLHSQADPGTGCPLTMTFASVPAIARQANIAQSWLPKITANHYDGRNIPFYEKQGLTIGMAMTEKQGGSDVRANTTKAYPVAEGGPGAEYSIVGHKWFCSAPMCDAFLVLAYVQNPEDNADSQGRLSCFLLPRWRPNGQKNEMYIQRLKDKMGNVSNASSEVEYRGALAWMIGPQGRGVATIIEMVSMTRFDCMVGSSAAMRLATAQAIHHTGGRHVFGKPLHEQPLMQNVLADLAIEAEAALAITMRIAHALDATEQQDNYQHELRFSRVATAVGKYWICKRTAVHHAEAMECIGGVGLVEDNVLARLYREAPVNAIWEGSGNVQCLDVLRALHKDPRTTEAFFSEIDAARGQHASLDNYIDQLKRAFADTDNMEYRARSLVEQMAKAWQASLLLTKGDPVVAEAFIRSRIENNAGLQLGTLPVGVDVKAIIERATARIN